MDTLAAVRLLAACRTTADRQRHDAHVHAAEAIARLEAGR